MHVPLLSARAGPALLSCIFALWHSFPQQAQHLRFARPFTASTATTEYPQRALAMSKTDIWSLTASAFSAIIPDSAASTVDAVTRWQQGVTPLSTHAAVAGAMITYLISIFGVQEIMKDRKPMSALQNLHVTRIFGDTGPVCRAQAAIHAAQRSSQLGLCTFTCFDDRRGSASLAVVRLRG